MPSRDTKDLSAIVFDIDGTLIEPMEMPPFNLHKKFLNQICGDSYSFSDDQISNALKAAADEMWQTIPPHEPHYDFPDGFLKEYDRLILVHLGVEENLQELTAEYRELWIEVEESLRVLQPDLRTTLDHLKARGFKLGIATNWTNPRERLAELGILDYFQCIEYSVVPGYRKPSPYMLIQNARELGVNPLNCAFVGDNIDEDIPAAKRAGMYPILLINKGHETPKDDGSYTIIHEIGEILEIIP